MIPMYLVVAITNTYWSWEEQIEAAKEWKADWILKLIARDIVVNLLIVNCWAWYVDYSAKS